MSDDELQDRINELEDAMTGLRDDLNSAEQDAGAIAEMEAADFTVPPQSRVILGRIRVALNQQEPKE